MQLKGIVILAIINIPLYFLIAKLLFESWEGFFDAIKFWLTPDSWSFLTGEFWDDAVAEFKLAVWVVGSAACVYGEIWLINKLMG